MKIYLPSYLVLMSFFVVWSSAAAMISLEQKLAKTKVSLTSLRDKLTILKSSLEQLKKSLEPAEPLTAEEQKQLEGYEKNLKSGDVVSKREALDGIADLVEKGKILDRATIIAQEALTSSDTDSHRRALKILCYLVEQGRAIDIALAAAEKNIMAKRTRVESLGIIEASLKKGKGFKQALEVAKKLLDSSNSADVNAGYDFLSNLIKYDNQITKDLLTHAKVLLDPSSPTWQTGIKFLNFLLAMEKGISDATELAKKYIDSPDEKTWSKGVVIFALLLAHEKVVDETMAYAEKLVKSSDKNVWLKGIALYERLFEHGKAFDKAIPITEKAITSPDKNVKDMGEELLNVMSNILNHFKDAIQSGKDDVAPQASAAAGQVARSATNKNLLFAMNALFGELFEQGYGFKEAVDAAPMLLSVAPLSAMNFFKIAIEKGKELDVVFAEALKMIKSPKSVTEVQGYTLLRTFIEYNHLLNKVLQVAVDNVKTMVKHSPMALIVLKMLAENNYKPDQIYDAAQSAIELNKKLLLYGPMLDVFKALQDKGYPLSDQIKKALSEAI